MDSKESIFTIYDLQFTIYILQFYESNTMSFTERFLLACCVALVLRAMRIILENEDVLSIQEQLEIRRQLHQVFDSDQVVRFYYPDVNCTISNENGSSIYSCLYWKRHVQRFSNGYIYCGIDTIIPKITSCIPALDSPHESLQAFYKVVANSNNHTNTTVNDLYSLHVIATKNFQ